MEAKCPKCGAPFVPTKPVEDCRCGQRIEISGLQFFSCEHCHGRITICTGREGQKEYCPHPGCGKQTRIPFIWEETIEITTLDGFPGRRIDALLGVVTGSAILGTNVFKDVVAGLADLLGGGVPAYDKVLRDCTRRAIFSLKGEAARCQADCVVGVRTDVTTVGTGGIFLVQAIGSAARLAPLQPSLQGA